MAGTIQSMPNDVFQGRITQLVFPSARGVVLQAQNNANAGNPPIPGTDIGEIPGSPTVYGPPFVVEGAQVNPPLGTADPLGSTLQRFIHAEGSDPRIQYGVGSTAANLGMCWRSSRRDANADVIMTQSFWNGGSAIQGDEWGMQVYEFENEGNPAFQRIPTPDASNAKTFYLNGKILFNTDNNLEWGTIKPDNFTRAILGICLRVIAEERWAYIAVLHYSSEDARYQFGIVRTNIDADTIVAGTGYVVEDLGFIELDQAAVIVGPGPVKFSADGTQGAFIGEVPMPLTGSPFSDITKRCIAVGLLSIGETSWGLSVGERGTTSTSASGVSSGSAPPDSADRIAATTSSGGGTTTAPYAVDFDDDELFVAMLTKTTTTSLSSSSNDTTLTYSAVSQEDTVASISTKYGGSIQTQSFSVGYNRTAGGDLLSGLDCTNALFNSYEYRHITWVDPISGFWVGCVETQTETVTNETGNTLSPSTGYFIQAIPASYQFGKGATVFESRPLGTRQIWTTNTTPAANFFDNFPDTPITGSYVTPSESSTASPTTYREAMESIRKVQPTIIFGGEYAPAYHWMYQDSPVAVLDTLEDHFIAEWREYSSEEFNNRLVDGVPDKYAAAWSDHRNGGMVQFRKQNGYSDGDIRDLVFSTSERDTPHVSVFGVL